jgi:hypothetical protein
MAVVVANACVLTSIRIVSTLTENFREHLIASWINCMLFALELVLMVKYFSRFSGSRSLLQRIGIGAIFVLDAVCTIAVCVEAYIIAVVFPCEQDLQSIIPTLPYTALILFTTYSTASLEQLFLCGLFFSLYVPPNRQSRHYLTPCSTKNRTITIFLLTTIACHVSPWVLPDATLPRRILACGVVYSSNLTPHGTFSFRLFVFDSNKVPSVSFFRQRD